MMIYRVKVIKLIVLAVLVAAAIIIAAAFLYARKAPTLPNNNSAFVFKNGRLWASIDDENQTVALIDSGTAMSVFPEDWNSLGEREEGVRISTPFGQSMLSTRGIEPLKIGGTLFEGKVLAGSVSYPLIGGDFIFSKSNVLFTRDGLEFDVRYDPEDAVACVGIVVSHQGNTTKTPVESIHLLLNIDGAQQKVYFDTGRAAALEASASAPESERKLFPRFDIRFNALGQWSLVSYFGRQAVLSLGDEKRSLFYRHYFINKSLDAPFVMGAGILKDYSILIDPRKGRACFFKAAE